MLLCTAVQLGYISLREQGAEEYIWIKGTASKRRMEEATK